MGELGEIKTYLLTYKFEFNDKELYSKIKKLKKKASFNFDKKLLNEIWCLEKIYQKPNVSFEKNIYNLCFIEKMITGYEILFRTIYRKFFSRELLVKSYRCSICNKRISLRSNCGHKKGHLYWGKLCSHIAENIEILGFALVEYSVERYTVLQENKNIKYDYSILRNLMLKLTSPYVFWNVKVLEKDNQKHYSIIIK